ncbi:ShlB/FhaC/HecB family hemolysin secretion/activation protein [Salmonella enterica subsp. enterica]|uniref:ShlB/FhaC/HecB family hemolysin secretion/activation protein n=1 Tax=Salmonella enterica subsp. enterica serovar Java TaxID=224729 RepID=A0A3Z6QTQ7_SALEB|nr:ShlB/FhaC/HecB family hemolysin secretion/activation protein [Salmonella enterica subsp. enterica serovar Java]EAU6348438.1 ShlB/FhaC/HecB family hemolysin secretion/activation protein [Salmonella enterica]
MEIRYRIPGTGVAMLSALFCLSAKATTSQSALHQQAQQKALQEKLVPATPDVRLAPGKTPENTSLTFLAESPCFPLTHIDIQGRDNFPHWVPFSSFTRQIRGNCLGIRGITQLADRMQDRLSSYGWVTSRVLVPGQDLRQDTLHLQIVPGRIISFHR